MLCNIIGFDTHGQSAKGHALSIKVVSCALMHHISSPITNFRATQ